MRRGLKHQAVASGSAIDEKRTEVYYWWLLVAIVFEYARPGAFLPGIQAAKLNSLIPLSLLAVILIAPGLRPFQQIYADRSARWLTLYLGLMILSVPFAEVTEYSFNIFTKVLGYYFLFLIIARVVTSTRRLRGIFGALLVSHLFLIVMNPEIVLNTEVRSYIEGGTFLSDGNDFSLSLCILIPMTVELAFAAKKRHFKAVAIGAMLVMLMAMVGTQSRGATLGIVAVGGFLWLLSKQKIASLVAILLIGSVAVFHASDTYFTRMGTIKTYQDDGSAQGRIIAWKAGTRMALDNPLLGVGTGHFPVSFGTKYRPRDVGSFPWLTAHSTFFLVLGELGFPGAVTILALVMGGFVATMAVRRRVIAVSNKDPLNSKAKENARMLYLLAASVVGFGVAGAFLSASYYPHIFVLTGILIAARSIALHNLDARQSSPEGQLGQVTVKARRSRLPQSTLKRARGGDT